MLYKGIYDGFVVEDSDMFSFNRKLKEKGRPNKLILNYKGKEFSVDLKTGEFFVNDILINLGEHSIDIKGKELRWINFRRRIISYVMGGKATEKILYVIGWQTTVNRKNIKRMIAINEDGDIEIWTEDQKGIVEAEHGKI